MSLNTHSFKGFLKNLVGLLVGIYKYYIKNVISYLTLREEEGMPHFHFELHIVLVKLGEKPIHMTKRVMDIYMSIIVEVAYNMAKSYLQDGWKIEKLECRNFEFFTDINLTWGD
jgi:hypothetical protein